MLREDGRQTVIVTNRTDLPAVEVVRRLFRRWRQENYFKYMEEEFALDALVEYGVEEVSEEATPAQSGAQACGQGNGSKPRRKCSVCGRSWGRRRRRTKSSSGRPCVASRWRRPVCGRQLEQAELREQELAEQQRQLPKRVPAKGVKTLKKEKKLIVDAIKIIAYQCETALLDRLRPHYARADDEGRTLLHAAFQSSASMKVTETELQITHCGPIIAASQ